MIWIGSFSCVGRRCILREISTSSEFPGVCVAAVPYFVCVVGLCAVERCSNRELALMIRVVHGALLAESRWYIGVGFVTLLITKTSGRSLYVHPTPFECRIHIW